MAALRWVSFYVFALHLRVEPIQCYFSLVYPLMHLHYRYAKCLGYFSIGPCCDREHNAIRMHPIPAVLKPVYGVGSLATLT